MAKIYLREDHLLGAFQADARAVRREQVQARRVGAQAHGLALARGRCILVLAHGEYSLVGQCGQGDARIALA